MRTVLSIVVFILLAFEASAWAFEPDSTKFAIASNKTDSDSMEYELVILEIGYETFLITKPSMHFYSEQYYKNWNYRYVTEWNIQYQSGKLRSEFAETIDYNLS